MWNFERWRPQKKTTDTFQNDTSPLFLFSCPDQAAREDEEDPQWKKLVGGGFTEADEFCVSIRRLQKRTGCSDVACNDMISTFRKYLRMDVPTDFTSTDRRMREASGASFLRLHGCVHCNKHVFLPDDKSKNCPLLCGFSRFDSKGLPREQVFYFPLRPKLQSLLRLPKYREMCEHEFWRQQLRQGEHVMSDVYDAPIWKSFMGPPVHPVNRIGKWDYFLIYPVTVKLTNNK